MSFIWPAMLVSLLLLPLFGVLYARVQRRRRRLAEQFGGFGLVHGAVGNRPGLHRRIPPLLFLLALALLSLALARPQATVSLPRLEGTVVLIFDVSGSMAATDVEPTRMEAARAAAKAFVERQPPTTQIGVVAFSDGGLAVQVPTSDQPTILAAIDRLTPQRGTSIGEGILAALNAIAANAGAQSARSGSAPTALPATPGPQEKYPSAVIVLLSDGENNGQPDPLDAAQAAAERDVRIYPVGIGSAAGATLQLDGFSIHTRLEEAALRQIAELTGGTYYSAQDSRDMRSIYDEVAARLVVRPEETEVTALFATAGMVFLLIGGMCSFIWFNRLA